VLPLVWVLADYSGTLDSSNRTEVRGRTTQGVTTTPTQGGTSSPTPAGPPNPSLDVADIATILLRARSRASELSLGYTVLGILGDVEVGGGAPQAIQSADARASWHERRVRVELGESGQYGVLNSAYLLATPAPATPTGAPVMPPGSATPGVQQLPPSGSIQYGSSRSSLASDLHLTRRWLGSTRVEYAVQGGLGSDSQALLPLVRGPRAEVGADFLASRIDSLATRADVFRSDTSTTPCSPALVGVTVGDTCSPTAEAAELRETWRHALTREDAATAAAGASYVHTRLRPPDSFRDVVYPMALVGFEHSTGRETSRTTFRAEAQIAPFVDLRSGAVDERVQANVSLGASLRSFAVSGTLAGARSVASPFLQPVTVLQAACEVEYRVDRTVGVGGGVRYSWQQQDPIPPFSGGIAFVQITLRVPKIRF
jgi:hypothetical protein